MNEEVNNNYNNTPNYNYEKKNNGGNALLIILIILVTLLIALLCYKMFIYDKKNNNINVNKVEEKNDNNENTAKETNNGTSAENSTTQKLSTYKDYLNKLSSEISNKYADNEQFMSSQRVGGYEKLSYSITLSNDKVLMLNNEKIASNVLEYYAVDRGQDGSKTLYYIDVNGDVYSVAHEAYLLGYTDISSKKLSYKNIVSVLSGVTSGLRTPIFIDIDGNIYIGENN